MAFLLQLKPFGVLSAHICGFYVPYTPLQKNTLKEQKRRHSLSAIPSYYFMLYYEITFL